MIKPTSLWNFIHECELGDAEYIGRICLALAGKPDIPFTRAEKIQLLAIRKDNLDMDERIEESRERDRKRKAEAKARRNGEIPPDSHGIPRNPTDRRGRTRIPRRLVSSVRPSLRPSVRPRMKKMPFRVRERENGNRHRWKKYLCSQKTAQSIRRQKNIPIPGQGNGMHFRRRRIRRSPTKMVIQSCTGGRR